MATITLSNWGANVPSAIVFNSVVRDDTGEAVSFTTNWAETSPGSRVWQGTFVAPTPGLTYSYTATATINGAAYPFPGSYYDSGSGYVGRYTSDAKITKALGDFNKDEYASTNGSGAPDPAAVQQAIVTAEGRVDFYTGGPFTFSDDLNGTVAAACFERWSRVLASFELYAKRVPNDNDAGKALTQWYKEAIAEMKAFNDGEALLPGAIPANTPTVESDFVLDAPIAVGPTVNPDGSNINAWPRFSVGGGRINYG